MRKKWGDFAGGVRRKRVGFAAVEGGYIGGCGVVDLNMGRIHWSQLQGSSRKRSAGALGMGT